MFIVLVDTKATLRVDLRDSMQNPILLGDQLLLSIGAQIRTRDGLIDGYPDIEWDHDLNYYKLEFSIPIPAGGEGRWARALSEDVRLNVAMAVVVDDRHAGDVDDRRGRVE